MSIEIRQAVQAYNLLNGVFCVYKPKLVSFKRLRSMLLERVSQNLNEFEVRPMKERVVISEKRQLNAHDKYAIEIHPNLADSVSVTGPRYQTSDMTLKIGNYIGYDVSGLVLVGIRSSGCLLVDRIRRQRLLREYEIECMLGKATDNFMADGKVIEKSTYSHLNRSKVDFILNKIQTNQQSTLYTGLDLKSQAAYEMALKGAIKPAKTNLAPVLYSLKCVHFQPPHFTVRLVTLNENSLYFKNLINGIGLDLRSNACVINMRCTKYGPFVADRDALLSKHWNVEHIIQSIVNLKSIVEHTANPHLQKLQEK